MDMITSGPYSICDRLQTRNQLKLDYRSEHKRETETKKVKTEKMRVQNKTERKPKSRHQRR